MPASITNHGLSLAISSLLNQPGGLVLRLFTNDDEPSETTAYKELVASGYHAEPLIPPYWKSLQEGALAEYEEREFEFRQAVGKVFGYYITDASGRVIVAERFPVTFDGKVPGDKIKIRARIGMRKGSGDGE